jgi:hypothetical protein
MRMLPRHRAGATLAIRNEHAVVAKPNGIKQARPTPTCECSRMDQSMSSRSTSTALRD